MSDASLLDAHGAGSTGRPARPLTTEHEPGRLVRVDELARMLGTSRTTVYRMVERGEIPFYRVSASLRFDLDEVKRHLAAGHNPTHL